MSRLNITVVEEPEQGVNPKLIERQYLRTTPRDTRDEYRARNPFGAALRIRWIPKGLLLKQAGHRTNRLATLALHPDKPPRCVRIKPTESVSTHYFQRFQTLLCVKRKSFLPGIAILFGWNHKTTHGSNNCVVTECAIHRNFNISAREESGNHERHQG